MNDDELREFVRAQLRGSDAMRLIRQLQAAVLEGTGSPEGQVTAAVGTLYRRRDGGAGTTLYVKESGAGPTGWVAK